MPALKNLWARIKGWFSSPVESSGSQNREAHTQEAAEQGDSSGSDKGGNTSSDSPSKPDGEAIPPAEADPGKPDGEAIPPAEADPGKSDGEAIPPVKADPGESGAPQKRPGGRRDSNSSTVETPDKSPRAAVPELKCREKENHQWQIFLSPEGAEVTEVRQGGVLLNQASDTGGYPVQNYRAKLVYKLQGEDKEVPLHQEDAPLIFKMKENWKGKGCRLPGITSGYFIVIVPKEWERKSEENPPVAYDGCEDNDFYAHYFHRERGETESRPDGFDQCPSLVKASSEIKLIGQKQVFDAIEGRALFVEKPPGMEVDKSQIKHARIGNDRVEGPDEWKGDNFDPSEKSIEKMLQRREGNFYIRVYDKKPKLLDSTEFRYLQSLREIRLGRKRYSRDMLLLPGGKGYRKVKVEFVGVEEARLQSESEDDRVQVKGNTAIIAPCAESDRTDWKLKSRKDGGSVPVGVHIPRVWWCLADKSKEYRWQDKVIELTVEEFREHASNGVCVAIRLPPTYRAISVGFGAQPARTAKQTRLETCISVPLREHADDAHLARISVSGLPFNVSCAERIFPCIKVNNSKAACLESAIEPLLVLRPRVLSGSREWREGKGFSRGELEAACINVAESLELCIVVDKRRRAVHDINVESLKQRKEAWSNG